MNKIAARKIIDQLYDEFESCTKPDPLATYEGSYCNEEVDFFNSIDWETATYHHLVEGMEGWIVHPPETTAYLIPHLFRMLVLDRDLPANVAVDNHVQHLIGALLKTEVSELLSKGQKQAIIRAWDYLDTYVYYPSHSRIAYEFSSLWSIQEG